MDTKTLAALKGSIRKWEGIAAGTDRDGGDANCPLCALFHPNHRMDGGSTCRGCPVFAKTGRSGCENSPYAKWTDHRWDEHGFIARAEANGKVICEDCTMLAGKELRFLKSLLPQPKRTSSKKSRRGK